jgi:hypothetical protein
VDTASCGLHCKHEWRWRSPPDKYRGVGTHPNDVASMRLRERSGAAALRGGGDAPADGSDRTRFLLYEEVAADVRFDGIGGRMPWWSELTEEGNSTVATTLNLVREVVLRWLG